MRVGENGEEVGWVEMVSFLYLLNFGYILNIVKVIEFLVFCK